MLQLNKKIKTFINDMDKTLLIFSLVLLLFGLLNIVTASSREAVSLEVPLYYYFYKHLIMLIIGIVGGVILINIPTVFYKKTIIFLVISIATFIGLTLVMSDAHRGAQNWINIGFMTFQPSEFAKPLIIVGIAVLFERYYNNLRTKKIKNQEIISQIILVGCVIPGLVFLQKDFGTMFIMLMIFGIMFLLSPILKKEKIKTIMTLGIIGIIGILGLLIIKGEVLSQAQLDRFDFINPCKDYENNGYQICNAYIAINDGGLLGLGIGKSKQKYSYIAEPHTDMVFSIFVEEYGFFKSSPVFLAYLIIIYRILMIGGSASTIRGRYICYGVAAYIFMHIFINLGGLFGLIPLTGVPLPFLSYGGSFTISLIAALALVQRVHIETINKKIKIKSI